MPTQNFNNIPGNTPITWPRLVGTATLVLGTVTVNDPNLASNSIIHLTPQDGNTLGVVRVTNKDPGNGFTITSSLLTDSGVIAYAVY